MSCGGASARRRIWALRKRASSPCRSRCARRAIRPSWLGNGILVRMSHAGRVSAALTGTSRSSAVLASNSPVTARGRRRAPSRSSSTMASRSKNYRRTFTRPTLSPTTRCVSSMNTTPRGHGSAIWPSPHRIGRSRRTRAMWRSMRKRIATDLMTSASDVSSA